MNHSLHYIHVWFLVIGVYGWLTSEQARKVVLACLHAQNLPLLAPPNTPKDEMLPRL